MTFPGKPLSFLGALEVERDLELFDTWTRLSDVFCNDAQEGFSNAPRGVSVGAAARLAVMEAARKHLVARCDRTELRIVLYALRYVDDPACRVVGLSDPANRAFEAYLKDPEETDYAALETLLLGELEQSPWR